MDFDCGDAQYVLTYFKKMQAKDPQFFMHFKLMMMVGMLVSLGLMLDPEWHISTLVMLSRLIQIIEEINMICRLLHL